MVGRIQPMPARFNADDFHLRVVEERMEQAHRIGTTANAGDETVGQAAFAGQHLLFRFAADD